jgi:flagellar hook-basal body complex protein FliE
MIEAINALQTNDIKIGMTDVIQSSVESVGFIESLNINLQQSSAMLRDLATGKDVPSHELMLNFELAKQQLLLTIEIRNKCVDAYQELMRLQM